MAKTTKQKRAKRDDTNKVPKGFVLCLDNNTENADWIKKNKKNPKK